MLDNGSVLEQADTATLIAAALECSKQQAEILSDPEMLSDDEVKRLQELEQVRARLVHRIDWTGIGDVAPHAAGLRQLQRLDEENRQSLAARRDELAERLELFRKRRDAASAYRDLR